MNESRTPASAVAAQEDAGAAQPAIHIGFALCMLAFVILYLRSYLLLAATWEGNSTLRYAFLIFPVSAMLVWARRRWLAHMAARPRPGALWGVAALGVLWLAGAVAEVDLALYIAVVAIWPVVNGQLN